MENVQKDFQKTVNESVSKIKGERMEARRLKLELLAEKPAALVMAEELVKTELGLESLEVGAVTLYRRLFSGGYRAEYRTGPTEAEEIKKPLEISDSAYEEYRVWFEGILGHGFKERLEGFKELVLKKDVFSFESEELLLAFKIYEMLAERADGLRMLDLLEMEQRFERAKSSIIYFAARNLGELPRIAGEDGHPRLMARRALEKLTKAGLLSRSGKAKGVRYYALPFPA